MKRKYKFILLLLAALMLSGCMRTVDKMYSLPRRSEDFKDLQAAIDTVMQGLSYSAPLSGENQQVLQMADLNGDGVQEYLLFAKCDSDRPLRILIFCQSRDAYVHTQTIESNGSAFDLVEYVQMDDAPGLELVVGSQLADQVLRSVSVYTFGADLVPQLQVSANYTKFLTVDLDGDAHTELFVLHPGQSDTDNGVATLYGMENGVIERSNEMNMSQPATNLKRILAGKLHNGQSAVYVASTVDETAIITDVYAYISGALSNVSFLNESGTSVHTMRNYYVYADDIDADGVVELPHLITMVPLESSLNTDRHDLIRWYAMKADGGEVDKCYTYHNFVGGWYLELDSSWASRLTVRSQGNYFELFLWDSEFTETEKILTIYVLSGQNRTEQGESDDRFILHSTETVTYAASLEQGAQAYGITSQSVAEGFHLIQQDWKTGET